MKLLLTLSAALLFSLSSKAQVVAGFTFDTTICVGDCIRFTNTSSGIITAYGWNFQGGTPAFSTAQNPGLVCFTNPGTFQIDLGVAGPSGASDNISASILVGEYLDSVEAYSDTTIEMGGTAFLYAEGFPTGGTMSWIPNEFLQCDQPTICDEVFVSPLFTTSYIALYTSATGCSVRDTVIVTVKYKDVIDVANSFSPDDNGINDKVFVKGPGIVDMTFRIFDRYGSKVFETTAQNEGWDGVHRGEKLNPATFFWTLDYQLIDGTTNIKTGSVTLIK